MARAARRRAVLGDQETALAVAADARHSEETGGLVVASLARPAALVAIRGLEREARIEPLDLLAVTGLDHEDIAADLVDRDALGRRQAANPLNRFVIGAGQGNDGVAG